MAVAYRVMSGAFAAPAAVHTILNVIAPAGHGLELVDFSISADGVTASAVPMLVEICQSTQASAGTAGSAPTPVQIRGRGTGGSAPTAGANYTAEPTVLTVIHAFYLTPDSSTWEMPASLGREIECDSSAGTIKALAIRITPSATVNVRAMMEVENN